MCSHHGSGILVHMGIPKKRCEVARWGGVAQSYNDMGLGREVGGGQPILTTAAT
jgi:hypothetical protein